MKIDQTSLSKIKVPKAELSEEVIPDLHMYSMLMRFRKDKDLQAFDSTNLQYASQN